MPLCVVENNKPVACLKPLKFSACSIKKGKPKRWIEQKQMQAVGKAGLSALQNYYSDSIQTLPEKNKEVTT